MYYNAVDAADVVIFLLSPSKIVDGALPMLLGMSDRARILIWPNPYVTDRRYEMPTVGIDNHALDASTFHSYSLIGRLCGTCHVFCGSILRVRNCVLKRDL